MTARSFAFFAGKRYSNGSRDEPPSLNEPAAILSVDLHLDLLHFIQGCRCVVSTVGKIRVFVAINLPGICAFYQKIEQGLEC